MPLYGFARVDFGRRNEKGGVVFVSVPGGSVGIKNPSRMVGQYGNEHAVFHGKPFGTPFFSNLKASAGFMELASRQRVRLPIDFLLGIQRNEVRKVHERPGNHGRAMFRADEIPRDPRFLFARQLLEFGAEIVPRENFLQIRVERQRRNSVCERADGFGRIRSDSRERAQFVRRFRKGSAEILRDDLRGFKEVSGSGIIPEAFVVREEGLEVGSGKRFDRREFFRHALEKPRDPTRLRLLEEYFRKPNPVSAFFFVQIRQPLSPRQIVPAEFLMPRKQVFVRKRREHVTMVRFFRLK